MNAFSTMAGQLQGDRQPAPHTMAGTVESKPESKAARLRHELRESGQRRAKDLAEATGLHDTGLVRSLLKHDIQQDRVRLVDGWYSWNFDAPPTGQRRLGPGQEAITWYEANAVLPDAELVVFGRLRGTGEPVWLVYWTGERWLDVDGMPVEVVRWADLPKGGEA